MTSPTPHGHIVQHFDPPQNFDNFTLTPNPWSSFWYSNSRGGNILPEIRYNYPLNGSSRARGWYFCSCLLTLMFGVVNLKFLFYMGNDIFNDVYESSCEPGESLVMRLLWLYICLWAKNLCTQNVDFFEAFRFCNLDFWRYPNLLTKYRIKILFSVFVRWKV